jgi:hypothetical protein
MLLPFVLIVMKTSENKRTNLSQLKILRNYPFNVTERGCPAAALRVWPWKDIGRTPIGKSPYQVKATLYFRNLTKNHSLQPQRKEHIRSY